MNEKKINVVMRIYHAMSSTSTEKAIKVLDEYVDAQLKSCLRGLGAAILDKANKMGGENESK